MDHYHQRTPNAVTQQQLKALREAITTAKPFCSGTINVPQNELVLFYNKGDVIG